MEALIAQAAKRYVSQVHTHVTVVVPDDKFDKLGCHVRKPTQHSYEIVLANEERVWIKDNFTFWNDGLHDDVVALEDRTGSGLESEGNSVLLLQAVWCRFY